MSLKYYASWALNTWFGILHQKKYNAEWDEKLNELLDREDECKMGEYTLTIGDCEIWVGNRWGAYGFLWRVGRNNLKWAYRPSVKTMVRLAKLEDKLRRESELAELTNALNMIE